MWYKVSNSTISRKFLSRKGKDIIPRDPFGSWRTRSLLSRCRVKISHFVVGEKSCWMVYLCTPVSENSSQYYSGNNLGEPESVWHPNGEIVDQQNKIDYKILNGLSKIFVWYSLLFELTQLLHT